MTLTIGIEHVDTDCARNPHRQPDGLFGVLTHTKWKIERSKLQLSIFNLKILNQYKYHTYTNMHIYIYIHIYNIYTIYIKQIIDNNTIIYNI